MAFTIQSKMLGAEIYGVAFEVAYITNRMHEASKNKESDKPSFRMLLSTIDHLPAQRLGAAQCVISDHLG